MRSGVLFCSLLLALMGAGAQASEAPRFDWARYRDFVRKADAVNRSEPKLTPNPRFAKIQSWTLRYQGFSQRPLALQFYRVFLMPAKYVRLNAVSEVFIHLSRAATELGSALLPQVEMHIALIEDPNYKKTYVARYNQILGSLYPKPDGTLSDYSVFDCDYTSQPTNALWFMVNALIILDHYAISLFGETWLEEKRRLLTSEGVLSVEQIRQILSPGVSGHAGWRGVVASVSL